MRPSSLSILLLVVVVCLSLVSFVSSQSTACCKSLATDSNGQCYGSNNNAGSDGEYNYCCPNGATNLVIGGSCNCGGEYNITQCYFYNV